jgi:putative transposase
MPRRARLMLAGIPVHITHRGNNRQRCFYAESDYAFYLFHLRRLLPHAQCRLHAYCLMSNHVHLLLTPEKLVEPISEVAPSGKAALTQASCNPRIICLAATGTSS